MSKPLPKQKVFQALEEKLSGRLKFLALKWFFSQVPYRRGSDLYARRHPETKVDASQMDLMVKMKENGLSFMEIEEVMHLTPASGNDAYRCIIRKTPKEEPKRQSDRRVAA